MKCGITYYTLSPSLDWTTNPPEEEALYWVTVGSSVLLCNWRADKHFHLYGSLKAKVKWDQRSINPITPPEL